MYIITERMATDMLEMIMNHPNGRLSERITKFLIYQVISFVDMANIISSKI